MKGRAFIALATHTAGNIHVEVKIIKSNYNY
jgi:hypothetical protein